MNFNQITKVRLYNVYILPILLYVSDTWSMTVATSRRLDAFDQWCLRRILRIPYTAHVTNEEVRRRTGQSPVTSVTGHWSEGALVRRVTGPKVMV